MISKKNDHDYRDLKELFPHIFIDGKKSCGIFNVFSSCDVSSAFELDDDTLKIFFEARSLLEISSLVGEGRVE